MRNIVITFGLICFSTLVLLKMGVMVMTKATLPAEIVIGVFSGVFLIAGILIARKTNATHIAGASAAAMQAAPTAAVDHGKVNQLGISRREYEVLCELALGLSNAEIAGRLFVSESTVKTHVSSLLQKLNARRRTEAVIVAKSLGIII